MNDNFQKIKSANMLAAAPDRANWTNSQKDGQADALEGKTVKKNWKNGVRNKSAWCRIFFNAVYKMEHKRENHAFFSSIDTNLRVFYECLRVSSFSPIRAHFSPVEKTAQS